MTCKKCNKPIEKKDGKYENGKVSFTESHKGKDEVVEFHYYCFFTKPKETS